jgi:hypothetical protein
MHDHVNARERLVQTGSFAQIGKQVFDAILRPRAPEGTGRLCFRDCRCRR